MKSLFILTSTFLPLFPAVKVTVNSNHPVKYINEDTSESEIILRCDFKVSEEIQNKFQRSCEAYGRNKNKHPCAYVKWLAKGLPGAGRDQFVTIARPFPENRILDSYQTRFEVQPPYSLRLLAPIKHQYLNGTYQCRVEVDMDVNDNEDSADFDLYVRVPPKTVNIIAENKPQLDKPINFTCESDGQPKATVGWYFNDEKIEPTKDIPVLSASGKLNDDSTKGQFMTFDDGRILHIKKVMIGHKGQYKCKATNEALQEGLMSAIVEVEPTYLNMGMIFWVGSGVAIIAALSILIILCCCCCGDEKENKPPPGHILHGTQIDPKTGRQMNFSSGRHAVTPAKSQLTQSTFGSGGNTDDVFQQQPSDSYYSHNQNLPTKFDLEATLRSQDQSQHNIVQGTMNNSINNTPMNNAYEMSNTQMNYARQSQQQMYNNYNEQQHSLIQNSTHYDNY